ncbi:MAG: Cytochrome c biogenesis protein CcsA [candidate division BRC1 bacterium ADurb.BinA364]|nr:MAG: Cytochrome c biogenesis protein CcsA [candidate division BRC1 bacterium ADurb.BinA364]
MTIAAEMLFWLAAAMYLAGAIHYIRHFARGEGSVFEWNVAERLATFVFHAGFLCVLGLLYRQMPLVSAFNLLSLMAFCLAAVHTLLEIRFRTRETGMFFFGLALLFHLAAYPSLGLRPRPNPLLRNPAFALHAGAALLGYAGFLVSALNGAIYLAQYRMLKRRRMGLFFSRMPALDLLAAMNLHAMTVGFACLTFAILSGLGLSREMGVERYIADPKTIQSVAAWGLYAIALGGRYALGWRGRKQVSMSLAAFGLTLISVLAARFADSFHRFS